MKHYISDIKKQAEKVTTAITGEEMREAVSSAFSDTATALETMEESYRKRGKEMCIRSLEADIDRNILKINGREVQEPVVVTFPGPDGWPLQKLFNADPANPGKHKQIDITVNNTLL